VTEAGTKSRWRRHAIDLSPLRHTAYRRLFVGNAVSFVGYQFTAVAVPVQMYALTRSSLWVGLLGVAGFVPLLVFGLWGGAIADAFDRRRVLLGSSALMWAATFGLLVQALVIARLPASARDHWAPPAILLVLVAVQSTAFAISSPTRSAIIPRLMPESEVSVASTLNHTVSSFASVVGPLLAGVLIVVVDVSAAYAVDAALFTVAMWAALKLPAVPPARGEKEEAPATAGWRDVTDGLRYLGAQPVLLLTFAIDIAAMVLAMPRAVFPEVADERFGTGSIGWLYASIAIGSVLAGLTSGWIGRVRRQGLAVIVAVVAWGLAVAAAGAAPWLWLVIVLLAAAGAADMISAVYRQTIALTYAHDAMRGRLQGVFFAVVAGGPRLGDLRIGVTAVLVGPTVAWVGGGLAAVVVAVLLAAGFPALARYTPNGSRG